MHLPAPRRAREGGQTAVEYAALLAVLAALVALVGPILAHGAAPPALAHAVARRISDAPRAPHGDRWALSSPTWGPVLRRYVPALVLERDAYDVDRAVPVDPRRCRSGACAALGAGRPVVFVHLKRGPRVDYAQFWLYYPDSRTSHLPVPPLQGFHRDDWEGVIVRLDASGAAARATAHAGFQGAAPWWTAASGWRPIGPHPTVYRASGSHANGFGPLDLDLAADDWNGTLATLAPGDLELLPADELPAARLRYDSGATAPWRKRAWVDPEVPSTSEDGRTGAAARAAAAWSRTAAAARPGRGR